MPHLEFLHLCLFLCVSELKKKKAPKHQQKQLKYFASNKTESGKKKFKPGGLFPLKIFSFYKE